MSGAISHRTGGNGGATPLAPQPAPPGGEAYSRVPAPRAAARHQLYPFSWYTGNASSAFAAMPRMRVGGGDPPTARPSLPVPNDSPTGRRRRAPRKTRAKAGPLRCGRRRAVVPTHIARPQPRANRNQQARPAGTSETFAETAARPPVLQIKKRQYVCYSWIQYKISRPEAVETPAFGHNQRSTFGGVRNRSIFPMTEGPPAWE